MDPLTTSIVFFLGVSILFYVLFAGADFGAGILEIFLRKDVEMGARRIIARAMAPVWEANHIWLVLAVVILFMGFPKVYLTLSLYFHLPVIALLAGIVFRGCAFTFRYYDIDKEYTALYSFLFCFSSLWSAYFLGTIGGGMMLGQVPAGNTRYATSFIAPWMNPFCVAMGVFTIALFAFLASVYLVGEAEEERLRTFFRRQAAYANALLIVCGGAVFVAAGFTGLPLMSRFFDHGVSVACFVFSAVLWLPFWWTLKRTGPRNPWEARLLGATIVSLVLVGWYAIQFPAAVGMPDSVAMRITFAEAASPPAVLRALLGALIVGTLIILPALFYLLRVFKWQSVEDK